MRSVGAWRIVPVRNWRVGGVRGCRAGDRVSLRRASSLRAALSSVRAVRASHLPDTGRGRHPRHRRDGVVDSWPWPRGHRPGCEASRTDTGRDGVPDSHGRARSDGIPRRAENARTQVEPRGRAGRRRRAGRGARCRADGRGWRGRGLRPRPLRSGALGRWTGLGASGAVAFTRNGGRCAPGAPRSRCCERRRQ